MEETPVTLWYSTLGSGDGQDVATRGYLKALMKVKYRGLRLPPSISTNLVRFDRDLSEFSDLAKPVVNVMKPLKRVMAGDPRIGTTRVFPSLDDDGNQLLDNTGRKVETVITISEGSVDLDVEQERTSNAKVVTRCVVIHHDPAAVCRNYVNLVPLGRPHGVAFVGVTVWEASHIPEAVAVMLSELDAVVVPSRHAKDALVKANISIPVHVIPHSFDETHWPVPGVDEIAEPVNRERYVFYTVATPIERKNLKGLVRAYLKAFQGQKDIVLRIKSVGDVSAINDLIREALKESGVDDSRSPSVKAFVGKWPIDKVRAFHLAGDCYVSATRGEGFDLPVMEAKLCGSNVITTGWGASREILEFAQNPANDVLVPYKLIPVQGMYGIGCYEPDQQWADPDEEALIEAMRSMAQRRVGPDRASWVHLRNVLGPVAVGKQFSDVLTMAMDTAKSQPEPEVENHGEEFRNEVQEKAVE
jgi:glycosyltransferase involved in cell wall biosynthesis